MDSSRRQQINDLAGRVRKALDLDATPFDVDEAVRRLGGTIEDTANEEGEAFVQRRGDSFVIGLRSQGPETRRRFSVAHELGHLFLHMGFILDPKKWATIDAYKDSPRFRFGFSEEEYEAHEFAAALLMPRDSFKTRVDLHTSGGRASLEPVASHFNVSIDAARVRGQWLGLFEWQRR